MDWQSNVERRSSRDLAGELFVELSPPAAALSIVVLGLATLVLVGRSASGALADTSAPGWLVAWVIVSALLAAAARAAWFASVRDRSLAAGAAVLFAPSVALVLTVATLSATQAAPIVVGVIWLIAVGEELLAFELFAPRPPHSLLPARLRQRLAAWRPSLTPASLPRVERAGKSAQGASDPAPESRISDFDLQSRPAGSLADEVLQRIERVQSSGGNDILTGSLATLFVAGQATAHIHVAFCPTFERVPRIDYRQVAGPAARIKVGQVLPHGARFDVKLASPAAEPTRLTLEVRAALESAE
jgi:hypothetical protein